MSGKRAKALRKANNVSVQARKNAIQVSAQLHRAGKTRESKTIQYYTHMGRKAQRAMLKAQQKAARTGRPVEDFLPPVPQEKEAHPLSKPLHTEGESKVKPTLYVEDAPPAPDQLSAADLSALQALAVGPKQAAEASPLAYDYDPAKAEVPRGLTGDGLTGNPVAIQPPV